MTIRSTLERTEPVGLERPPGGVFLLATGAAAAIALDASSRDSGSA